MHARERVAVSLGLVTIASLVTKLWSMSLSDNESAVARIMEAAEASRVRAEAAPKGSRHAAYALGLCTAARIVMSDTEIERLTGVHAPSFEERLNGLLYQCTRGRRRARRAEVGVPK